MATRSTIAILETTGVVKQIYCHWDGYIEHNGRILKEHYKTSELVKELISHGDMSILAPNINTTGVTSWSTGTHSFDTPEADVCVYYGRDRGESNTEFRIYRDFDYFRFNRQSEEYDYLFVEAENKWFLLDKKAKKITFLSELDTVEETPNMFEVIKDNPAIKQTYTKILNGEMSYNDFCKVMLTVMSGEKIN